jgi:hypothetical protein
MEKRAWIARTTFAITGDRKVSTANPKRESSPKWTLAVNDQVKGQPLGRFVFVIVFSLLLLTGSTSAFGAAEVVRGKLVSVTQSAPHNFDYAFALVVSNGAPALNSATITASSRSREIQVIQGQVYRCR